MNLTPKKLKYLGILEKEINKAKKQLIIVEGKKDKTSLEKLGLKNIFIINECGKSIYEKIEQIEERADKKKICILTDFDKKGKKLYLMIKSELSKRKVKIDSSLRFILLKLEITHIEGLAGFINKKWQRI